MNARYIINRSASVALAALALAATGCTNEEDDIFDQSAAERLELAKTETIKLLCAAPAGWAMQYFADNTDNGGITLLMDFSTDGGVTIGACNEFTSNQFVTERSAFTTIADAGPVLTFNSYNQLLHIFADPQDDGVGYNGDYEFIIMDTSDPELVKLRGKKTEVDILLKRLPEGTDWESYASKLAGLDKATFSATFPLLLTAGEEEFTVSGMGTGVFHLVPVGGDAVSETDDVPYILEEGGLRLIRPYKGKEDMCAIQNFRLDDRGIYVCTDADQQSELSIGSPVNAITRSNAKWNIDATTDMAQLFTAASSAISATSSTLRYSNTVVAQSNGNMTVTFSYKQGKNTIAPVYTFVTSQEGDVMRLAYEGTTNTQGQKYYDSCPEVVALISALVGDWTVTPSNMLKPSNLTLNKGSQTFGLKL